MTQPTDLPPLPVGAVYTRAIGSVGASMYTYTADQMREYARAAVLAERERLLPLLAYAIREADGWHDECRGGPIEDDPVMNLCRAAIRGQ
jgi:hypothetical protein